MTASLDDAIEYAAQHLPEGWNVYVCVEKDAGWVELMNPMTELIDVDRDDQPLVAQVYGAVAVARQLDPESLSRDG